MYRLVSICVDYALGGQHILFGITLKSEVLYLVVKPNKEDTSLPESLGLYAVFKST